MLMQAATLIGYLTWALIAMLPQGHEKCTTLTAHLALQGTHIIMSEAAEMMAGSFLPGSHLSASAASGGKTGMGK
jgi:hypothetical protein